MFVGVTGRPTAKPAPRLQCKVWYIEKDGLSLINFTASVSPHPSRLFCVKEGASRSMLSSEGSSQYVVLFSVSANATVPQLRTINRQSV